MTEEARGSDREAAVELVQTAFSVGEIIEADRDKRIEQLRDSRSTSSFARSDLSRVDPAVVVDPIARVRTKVEDPTSWYAIVRAPDDSWAVVWACASNGFNESEYLGARRDGTITYDSTES